MFWGQTQVSYETFWCFLVYVFSICFLSLQGSGRSGVWDRRRRQPFGLPWWVFPFGRCQTYWSERACWLGFWWWFFDPSRVLRLAGGRFCSADRREDRFHAVFIDDMEQNAQVGVSILVAVDRVVFAHRDVGWIAQWISRLKRAMFGTADGNLVDGDMAEVWGWTFETFDPKF